MCLVLVHRPSSIVHLLCPLDSRLVRGSLLGAHAPPRVQLLVTCLVDRFFPTRAIGGGRARTPRHRGGVSCRADLLWPAGLQRRLSRRCPRDGAAHHRRVCRRPGAGGDSVGLVRRHGHSPVRRRCWPTTRSTAQRARDLAARTFEFTRFLVDELGVTDVGAAAPGESVAYHACCHGLRGLDVRDQPIALLEGVPARASTPLAEHDVCCGFGGLFAVKMSDISSAMLTANSTASRHVRRAHRCRHRRELCHAHGRWAAAARQFGAGETRRRSAGAAETRPHERRAADVPSSKSKTRWPTASSTTRYDGSRRGCSTAGRRVSSAPRRRRRGAITRVRFARTPSRSSITTSISSSPTSRPTAGTSTSREPRTMRSGTSPTWRAPRA